MKIKIAIGNLSYAERTMRKELGMTTYTLSLIEMASQNFLSAIDINNESSLINLSKFV